MYKEDPKVYMLVSSSKWSLQNWAQKKLFKISAHHFGFSV